MRRVLTARTAAVVAVVACFAASLLLLVLALDVARWRDALSDGDVRYRASAGSSQLWQPTTTVPFDAAETLLGLEDDVEFRQAVRSLRRARLDDPTISDPEIALLRNEAQARLEAIAVKDGNPERRSRAAGLLGVLGLARLVSETQDRVALLQSTVANLEFAIALDPTNDEAKFNLELALQRARGVQLEEASAGGNPTPGGAGSEGAGAGDPGSGY